MNSTQKSSQTKNITPKRASSNNRFHAKPNSTHTNHQRRNSTNRPKKNYKKGNLPRHTIPSFSMSQKRNTKIYLNPNQKLDKKLRISIIGGAEEVGRNCTMLEYDGDIIIIDMGLQFPEEDMPGIDYIIPNISYLKEKRKNIRGLIITHAHLDHIGALPHVMEDLGNPTIYTGDLSKGLIEKRQENFPGKQKFKYVIVYDKSKIKLGKFEVEFFHVNHNIINSFGIYIKTPVGNIVHTGDFKFDDTPLNDKPTDYNRLKEIGKNGVDLLLADSTNAGQPGSQISEYVVTNELESIFKDIKGRLIIGTFASNLNRIQQCITLAEKYKRKVILEGRSITNNVEIAHELNYFKVNTKNTITAQEYVKNRKNYKDTEVIIIGTGAQGERNAFLMKYVSDEHRFLKAESGDTAVFSSSVIPGNERTVSNLKDSLSRKNVNIIHYAMMDVHAGGHAKQEDLVKLIDLMKPKFYMPIEQSHYSLKINANTAIKAGFDPKNVFITDNGRIFELEKKGSQLVGKLTDTHIPADYVFVDGLGVGDISNIVIRDRVIMSQDGMLVIIATIDHKTGKLLGNPDIISRGFIYMKENKKLVEDTRMKVKKICTDTDKKSIAFDDHIKNKVREDLGEFLWKKTKRRPMILPVVIKV